MTELDLKLAFVPQGTIAFLKNAMHKTGHAASAPANGAGSQDGSETVEVLDFDAFLDDAFGAGAE